MELDERLAAVGLHRGDLDAVSEFLEGSDDRELLETAFYELASLGPHPGRELVRHPEWLTDIAAGASEVRSAERLAAGIRERVGEAPTKTALLRELRHTKRRESLRIFLREVRGSSLRETTTEIADLAAACLTVAVEEFARDAGEPELADAFCVLGMGKLGGRELNFSSDVDLVYVCSDEAMTDDDFRMRAIALGQVITDAIGANTSDGYVFRVDLRLRPDGTQGPLVQPASAMVDYYLQFGRTWERSAMLKARPVAGNAAIGHTVLEELEPFVYRRYLDFGALEELRAMKAKIEANAEAGAVVGHATPPTTDDVDAAKAPLADRLKRKLGGAKRGRRVAPEPAVVPADEDETGVLDWDVKIGVGGIREVEFFVQALQLVHCGKQPKLRVRNTLEALDVLLWAGLVPSDDHAVLTDAYDFFRRLEHRLQMATDRQHHRLPPTWAQFDVLAHNLGLTREQLREATLRHRERVRAIFERLFEAPERGEGDPTLDRESGDDLNLVVRASPDQLAEERVRSAIEALGFRRPRQVAGQLQVLRSKKWGPFRETAWGPELELARRLLQAAAASPDPDAAFSHLARFAQAVGDRPGYWTMLRDNPHATRLLLQVFGSSPYLSNALIRDPNVFERLLGVGSVAIRKSAAALCAELDGRLEDVTDPEHRFGIIRRFHREETLRAGLHETGGAARIEQTLEQLSFLAEVVIDRVLHEVYQPLRTRRRRPGSVLPPLDELSFAVVAMGKLGGRELGFGSDLDIIFVYEPDRQWKLEHAFFSRLAQRLIRTLSSVSAEGKMYEVDTRLRPSGSRGALVVSLTAFRDYYRDDAGTWERQALVRARPIIGPEALREAISDVRARVAFGGPPNADTMGEIRAMRDRVDEAMYERGTRDVKFGPGGLVDIEFAVQALQLLHGSRADDDPNGDGIRSGIRSESMREAISTLRQTGVDPDMSGVADAYLWLCRTQARLRLGGQLTSSVVPSDEETLERLARQMGHQGSDAVESFLDRLDTTMQRGRAFFEAVFRM